MNTPTVTWTFSLEQAQVVLAGVAKLSIEAAGDLHTAMKNDFIKTVNKANAPKAKKPSKKVADPAASENSPGA
jgi:hypothetical protein